ncbi:MAG: hypothetical protein AAF828_01955 [Bacteroidota bacterium]
MEEKADILLHGDWQQFGDHFWRGYAWRDGQAWTPAAYRGEELADFLPGLNGCFSWVGRTRTSIFGVCDRLGSYPLYYGKGIITDRLLPEQLDINWQWLRLRTWHYVEALPGNRTLDDAFHSLSPDHWLEWPRGQAPFVKKLHRSQQVIKQQTGDSFYANVRNICQRLINHANGRTIVILLSDGYDSRLLLAALHQLQCPNLVAATYGIRGNEVVEKAQSIADRLGVPFYFIDYANPEHRDFMQQAYPELVSRCSNGQSVPQEQELYAAHELRKLVSADSILVPGISGDLQAGSYVPPYSFRWPFNRRAKALKRWLRTRLTRLPAIGNVTSFWERELKLGSHTNSEWSAVHACEDIIVEERLSKYLCTTLRGYELAGFAWYLPLWDSHFIDFWQRQPIEARRYRKNYRAWCKQYFFSPLGVHFAGEGEKPRVHWGRIIRRFLPYGNRLAGGVPDPNQFSVTIAPLVGKEVPPTEVNTALGDWLIEYYSRQENVDHKVE